MLGMLLVGIPIYLSMSFLGHYYVEGVDYFGMTTALPKEAI